MDPADLTKERDSEQNSEASNYLMLSINDETIFGIVDEARAEAFLEGDARYSWTERKWKFEP